MRFFQISLLFFIFVSCSLPTTRGLIEESVESEYILNNYFSNEKIDYLYKAKINIYNKNFGGILIIKKIKDNHHRIVFTTEMGSKIFDFEFIENTFKVNYILDDMNKKNIINTLENDLQLLVKQKNIVIKEFFNAKKILYQSYINKRYNYYVYSKENKQLINIISTSKNKEKMTISYNNVNQSIANNIKINHQNFKMNIELNYISK